MSCPLPCSSARISGRMPERRWRLSVFWVIRNRSLSSRWSSTREMWDALGSIWLGGTRQRGAGRPASRLVHTPCCLARLEDTGFFFVVGLGFGALIATYSAPSIGDEIALGFYPRAAPAPEGINSSLTSEIVVAHDLQSPASVGRTVRLVAWVAVEALVQMHATHGDTAFARVSRVADDLVLAAYLRSPVDPGGEAVEVPGEAHIFAVAGPDGYQYPEGPVSLVLAREGYGPAFERRIDRVTPLQWVIDRVHAVGVVGLVAPSQAEVAVSELVPVVRLADDRVTRRDSVAGTAVRVPPLLRLHEEVGVRKVAPFCDAPLPAGGGGTIGGVLHLPFGGALLLRRTSHVCRIGGVPWSVKCLRGVRGG